MVVWKVVLLEKDELENGAEGLLFPGLLIPRLLFLDVCYLEDFCSQTFVLGYKSPPGNESPPKNEKKWGNESPLGK